MGKAKKGACCCHKPALALLLVRIGVALLFIIPGIMKLLDPDMFMGMLNLIFGWTGTMLVLMAWVVVLFEVVGGFFILLGKLVPHVVYKVSVLGIFIISLIALLSVHIPSGDIMGVVFQLFATLAVAGLWFTYPLCPLGITGSKDGEVCKL